MQKHLVTLALSLAFSISGYAQTPVGSRVFVGAEDAGAAPSLRPPTGNGAPASANCNSAKAIVSSTNATPIVVTSTAHGFVSGNVVTVYGHATDTAANGTWFVGSTTANTLQLCGFWDGTTCQAPDVGNGVGGATGFVSAQVGRIYFRNDATAGQNLYYCTDSTGAPAWTQQLNTGGAGSVTHTLGPLNASAIVVGNGGADVNVLASLGSTTTVLHGNAAGLPTFAAVALSTDVTGNLPVGNLNSGTNASVTTYWRGDGTWVTPPGAGTVTHTLGVLTASALVVGNGTADVNVLASLGTTSSVLHGNAAGLPTFAAVSLTADVTGNLPVGNLNSGTGASAATYWRGDGTWVTPPGTGTVTHTLGALTSTAIVTGNGTADVQTPSGSATVDGSGNIKGTSVSSGAGVTYTAGTSGSWGAGEGTAPTGAAAIDLLYADSTCHCWKVIVNNGTAAQLSTGATLNKGLVATGTTLGIDPTQGVETPAAAVGLVGDGATDNAAAFAAITSGTRVHLRDGATYNIGAAAAGGAVAWPSNVTFICSGCVIKYAGSIANYPFHLTGTNQTFDGVTFDLNGVATGSYQGASIATTQVTVTGGGSGFTPSQNIGVAFGGGTACTDHSKGFAVVNVSGIVTGVTITSPATNCTGAETVSTTFTAYPACPRGGTCTAPSFTYAAPTNSAGPAHSYGFYVDGATNFLAKNCRWTSTGSTAGSTSKYMTAIKIYNSSGYFDQPTVDNTLAGYQIWIDSNGTNKQVKVNNPQLDGSGFDALYLNSTNGANSLGNAEIAGGNLTNVTDANFGTGQYGNCVGIFTYQFANVHDLTCTGPRFSGIRVTGGNSTANPTSSHNVISHNRIIGAGEVALWAELGAEWNLFDGNLIKGANAGFSATNTSVRPAQGTNTFRDNVIKDAAYYCGLVGHDDMMHNTCIDSPIGFLVGNGGTGFGIKSVDNRCLSTNVAGKSPLQLCEAVDTGLTSGTTNLNISLGKIDAAQITAGVEAAGPVPIAPVNNSNSVVITAMTLANPPAFTMNTGPTVSNSQVYILENIPSATLSDGVTPVNGQLCTIGSAGATSFTCTNLNTTAGVAFALPLYGNAAATMTQLYSSGTTQLTWPSPVTVYSAQPFIPDTALTTTYQALTSDFLGCTTLPVASGTFTITLVASGTQPPAGQCIRVINYGTGVVTLARSGQNLNGGTASLTIPAGSATAPTGVYVVSDGTNYDAQLIGGAAGGAGTVTSSSFAQYQMAVGTTATNITGITPSATSGVPLISQGSSANPAFGTAVVAGGGTGLATLTAHNFMLGEGTSNVAFLSCGAGTAVQGSATDPTCTATHTLGVAGATAGTQAFAGVTAGTFTIGATPNTTASNTLLGPAVVVATGHMLTCTTASTTCTLTDGGAVGTAAAVNTGTSGAAVPLLNGTNSWSGVQTFSSLTNQLVFGASSNLTTLNFPASSGAVTLTMPILTGTILSTAAAVTPAQGGTGLATLTAHNFMLGEGTSNVAFLSCGAGTAVQGSATDPTCTATHTLGVAGATAGTQAFAGVTAGTFTIGATPNTTASNTLLGPAVVVATGHMLTCTTASTTCTLTDGGAVGTAAAVNTGTSGGTIPLLNGTNTWSGAQTFSSTVNKITLTAPTTAWTITPAADNQTTTIPTGTLLASGGALGTPSSGTLTSATGLPLNGVVSPTGAPAIVASGDYPLVFNSAATTASRSAFTIGETTAGTSTGTANLLNLTTITGSTLIPLSITQGAAASAANSVLAMSITGGAGGANGGATNPGKAGGGITITTGIGSNAGATSGTGGAAGTLSLTGAAGGTAAVGSTTGAGGSIVMTPGAAGGTGTAGAPGNVQIVGPTVGAALTTSFLNITGTWNTTGVVDAGIFENVTATAEGAASKLIDLQASTVSKFNVDYTGLGTFAAGVQIGTPPSCTAGTAGVLCQTEGTTPTGASSVDQIWADSANHCSHGNWNNTDVGCLLGASSTATLTNKSISLQQITSASGAVATFANGNNPLVFNSALTTASASAVTVGETTAATSTGTANLLKLTTLTGSTLIPLSIAQGAGLAATNSVLAMSVTGGAGGANAGATNPGWQGGGITLTSGGGSNAGATSGTGGAAGTLSLTGGAGGTAAVGSTTGAGGSILMTPGAAGGTGTAGVPGNVQIVGPTVGAALTTSFLNITGTWNTTGIVDAGIFANITNSASAAGSKVMDLQVGSASKLSLDVSGVLHTAANRVFVTSNFTTASASLVNITGLSWAFGTANANYSFHCNMTYSQATAAAANAFGIQAVTTAPTNLYAQGRLGTSLTASTTGVLPTLTTTTATNVVSATPSAFGTIGTVADMFTAEMWGTLEQGAGATTLNIMVLTGSASDSITVYRGSYCELEP